MRSTLGQLAPVIEGVAHFLKELLWIEGLSEIAIGADAEAGSDRSCVA